MDNEPRAATPEASSADHVTTTGPQGSGATTSDGAPRRRRRRGGRGRGRGRGTGGTSTTVVADGDLEVSEADATPAKRSAAKSTATSTPRTRRPPKPATVEGAEPPAAEAQAGTDTEAGTEAGTDAAPGGDGTAATPRKRRRRGGRGRGKKKPAQTGDDVAGADDEAPRGETPATQRDDAEPDADAAPAARTRTRSRTRGTKTPAAKPTGDAKPPKETKETKEPARSRRRTVEEQVAAGGPTRGIRTTRTRTGRDGRRRREPQPTPPRVTDKLMVITEHGDRDQIAVLEENLLVQHYVTRTGATSMVGNIYLGRVQNVLPGMEAAFVDVGRGRNGVLYAGEVNYAPEDIEGPAPRIEQILKPGQGVMVQVTKDPMGGKGARLTANLSLAGRYIVLAPNQNLQGISRRLGDEARKRLKTMLKRVKPPEHGVIVRTAAEGATEEELEADLRRLLSTWETIQKSGKRSKAPAVLYEEPELTVRVVRDLFTDEEFRQLVTDSQRVYDRVTEYLREVAPDLAEKVHLHTGRLPAFEEHRVVEQIHKALDRKVWLPSGGYLIIERTEAMTIIDVNTGKSVGKTNLEETVVNTNLEAAAEVARQLRLRDIGGIIVIDFIDMLLEQNKRKVEDTMRDALAIDKTRSQVFEIGPLGLMQVTRKRVSSGLVESFSETCPTCEGRGIILTYDVS
jgi:ribonuclease E